MLNAQFPILNSHPNRDLAMYARGLSRRMRIENWELSIGQISVRPFIFTRLKSVWFCNSPEGSWRRPWNTEDFTQYASKQRELPYNCATGLNSIQRGKRCVLES